MRFNISGFTHIGTNRQMNQDRILAQDTILAQGSFVATDSNNCFCFVADGIGGGPAGDFAAQFVLEQIRDRIAANGEHSAQEILRIMHAINTKLIQICNADISLHGAGTTLVGMIVHQEKFHLLNAGDSPAWILRNGNLLKITEDHILSPLIPNSPITSYFGGPESGLKLSFSTLLQSIMPGDLFVITSDGLLKALEMNQIKAILLNSKSLAEKSAFMLKKSLESGADDNLAVILIEVLAEKANEPTMA